MSVPSLNSLFSNKTTVARSTCPSHLITEICFTLGAISQFWTITIHQIQRIAVNIVKQRWNTISRDIYVFDLSRSKLWRESGTKKGLVMASESCTRRVSRPSEVIILISLCHVSKTNKVSLLDKQSDIFLSLFWYFIIVEMLVLVW